MSDPPVDPSRCPLCGDANVCGMMDGGSTCWCFDLVIPGEVLAQVPADAQGVACICRRCASKQKTPAAKVEELCERLRKR